MCGFLKGGVAAPLKIPAKRSPYCYRNESNLSVKISHQIWPNRSIYIRPSVLFIDIINELSKIEEVNRVEQVPLDFHRIALTLRVFVSVLPSLYTTGLSDTYF